jgi:hypothetical protein
MLPQIWESWLKMWVMDMCKRCHYTMAEAVSYFRLLSSFMLYIYKVFAHLLMFWIVIWIYTYTVTSYFRYCGLSVVCNSRYVLGLNHNI